MAAKDDPTLDDPESELRKRLVTQYAAEPSAPAPPDTTPDPPAAPPESATAAPTMQVGSPEAPQPYAAAPTAPAGPPDAYQGFPSQWAPGATAPSNAPAGASWDPTKAMYVSNGASQWSRPMEDQWMNFVNTKYGGTANGTTLANIIADYNKTYGTNAKVLGADKVDFGFGPTDVIEDVGGANRLWMGDYADPNGLSPNSRGGGGGAAGSIPGGAPQGGSFGSLSGSSAFNAPQGIWGKDFLAQLRQMLLARLQAAGGPVDENASGITQAVTGARDMATRQNDATRTALAERLYATGGLNTDAIGQAVQQSNERTGTALGTLRANLIMKEMGAKRTELRDLMQLALQSGDAEMARGIQMQIAELEGQLRREGYGVSLAEFGQNQNSLAGNPGSFS